jgi:hypothetical protein
LLASLALLAPLIVARLSPGAAFLRDSVAVRRFARSALAMYLLSV